MTELQDLKNGCICLDKCISIKQGLSVLALIGQGLRFNDEVDFGNGWVLRSSWNHFVFGCEVNVTFNFLNDYLKIFGFALANEGGFDLEDLKKKHDDLLRNLLGEPQKKNEVMVSYEFLWGGITSQKDPRGGSCSIEVNWL
ncbi:hypothetical protein IB254_22705 [Pseudomonas sp. PDM03]|uniref:hypothetical protein n=1 Tax=Pseudomonas sp. PDM03 TaxID=2769266 RepID=UPI00177D6967|nr:hypothetical protein [Pseudomonas sp. PDM03]MBD9589896.1 hypothetical protein [Pseudomonas sp. PDM03]